MRDGGICWTVVAMLSLLASPLADSTIAYTGAYPRWLASHVKTVWFNLTP